MLALSLSRLGLSKHRSAGGGGGAPEWLPEGASSFWDFKNGHYYQDGEEKARSEMVGDSEYFSITFDPDTVVDGTGLTPTFEAAGAALIDALFTSPTPNFSVIVTGSLTNVTEQTGAFFRLGDLPNDSASVFTLRASTLTSDNDLRDQGNLIEGDYPELNLGSAVSGAFKMGMSFTPSNAYGAIIGTTLTGESDETTITPSSAFPFSDAAVLLSQIDGDGVGIIETVTLYSPALTAEQLQVLTGATPYEAQAVYFDGGSALMIPSLTAPGDDTGYCSFSFWMKPTTFATSPVIWVVDPADTFTSSVSLAADNTVVAGYYDAAAGEFFGPETANDNIVNPTTAWHHVCGSVKTNEDTGEKVFTLFVDDADHVDSIDDVSAAFLMTFDGLPFFLFSDTFGADYVGDIADVWIAPGVFVDFSVEANRRFFLTADGKPVDLGADGSTPTGDAPAIFFSGDASEFSTNKGTGGEFVIVGAPLTDANASEPVECVIAEGGAPAWLPDGAYLHWDKDGHVYADGAERALGSVLTQNLDWSEFDPDICISASGMNGASGSATPTIARAYSADPLADGFTIIFTHNLDVEEGFGFSTLDLPDQLSQWGGTVVSGAGNFNSVSEEGEPTNGDGPASAGTGKKTGFHFTDTKMSVCADGGTVTTRVPGVRTAPPTDIVFGCPSVGFLEAVTIYTPALTDEQLQALTA